MEFCGCALQGELLTRLGCRVMKVFSFTNGFSKRYAWLSRCRWLQGELLTRLGCRVMKVLSFILTLTITVKQLIWRGQATHKGKQHIFAKNGVTAAPHPVRSGSGPGAPPRPLPRPPLLSPPRPSVKLRVGSLVPRPPRHPPSPRLPKNA